MRGPAALEPSGEFDANLVMLGIALHFALALPYALALSCIVAEIPRRFAGLAGIGFGLALYEANFYGFAALFPWFAALRTIDTVAIHALFGALLAIGYWIFARRRD